MRTDERKRIDDFIKEYLLLDIKIKISKAKIIHAEYNNNVLTVNKQQDILHQLEQLKTNIVLRFTQLFNLVQKLFHRWDMNELVFLLLKEL